MFGFNIILTFASTVLNVAVAYVLKSLIDVCSTKNLNDFYNILIFFGLYLACTFIIDYLAKVLRALFIKKIMFSLKNDVFDNIISKDIKSFNTENTAEYISTLTNDMNIIETDYFTNILEMIGFVTSFVIATILIFNLSFYISLGVFVISIFPIFIPKLFEKNVSARKKNYSDSLGSFTTKIKDIFSGYEVIKNFNIENKIGGDFKKSNLGCENSKYKFSILSSLVEEISSVLGFLMFFTALALGTYFTIKGSVTVGTMIAVIQLMNSIVNPLINMSIRLNKLKSVKLISSKIETLTHKIDSEEKGTEKPYFENSIEFKDVNFSYTKDRTALENVSLQLQKGSKYAIVGGSGSGKSTILKLLLRYYEDFKGNIYIDGIDNRDIKVSDLYKLVSVIQQNVFMFDSSIKDNITLYENYNNEDVQKAIKLAGLENLVNSLPQCENSLVGENGSNLSGGEKQRIAIARALIKNTPILVLDEATSALDNETAYHIEKSLLNIPSLTSIVVTHKLSEELLSKYDGIIALKDGKVVEQGSFYELMKNKSYFYSLFTITAKDKEQVA